MVLVFHDLSQAVASFVFYLVVTLQDELEEQRQETVVYFRHIEQVDNLCQILQQQNVISPKPLGTLQVVNEHHESLKEVGVHDLALPLRRSVDLYHLLFWVIEIRVVKLHVSVLFLEDCFLVAVEKCP